MNLTVRQMVTLAWGYRDNQIIGGPSWMAQDRFIINAKAETNAPPDQLRLMLRALLAERFQMHWRDEKRELPGYALIVATKDGKPSPRLKTVDCAARKAATPAPLPTAGASAQMPCGAISSQVINSSQRLRGALPMSSLASLLGSIGGLGTVVDRTGLTGTYEIELEIGSILGSSLQAAAPGVPGTPSPAVAEGPSLLSTIADLGLKLERRREQIDVLVIDSIQQPDED
jgi:uncharacterized protein (TIGR03435 family)